MNLYLRKLKVALLFKILIFFLFIFAVIRIILFNINYKIYKNEGIASGVIKNINKKDDYTIIDIKSAINYKAYIFEDNNLKIGDYISFNYENKDVSSSTIFNTFNYKMYLKSKNINQVIIIKTYKKGNKINIYKVKNYVYEKIINKKSKNYIFTFLCGDKSYIDLDIRRSFTNNGISHLLCVSGFHVLFLFNFLKKILKILIKSEIITIFILILVALIYLLLTDFMVALFRAVLMYFLSLFGKKFSFNINSMYYYLLTLFLSLVLWPFIVYNAGFYYTFVLSLFLIINRFNTNNIFKVSIYCFIISMPITIYINYSLNLLSVIYSILSSFFVCYILYLLSFISIFSKLSDQVLYKLSSFFDYLNIKSDYINYLKIVIPKQSIIIIVLLYLIYFLYIVKPNVKIIALYVIIVLYMLTKKYFNNNLYLYFIDVKQGDMSVIVQKNFKNVTIIDTGGIVGNGYLKQNIKQFLNSLGISKINTLITTHGDYDHMGEAINLVENFKVEKVIFNCGPYNDLEKELIKVLDKKKIKYYSCIKELNIDDNKLYFLQTKEYDNENDNSNVIYTELNGYKFMFMGDASSTTEKEIMQKYNLLNIDVLKVGHHGSKTSSSKEFINEINPRYSIISVGKNNRYGHPNKEVLDNLYNSKVYRTDEDGSIMFKIKNNKLKIDTCSP